LVKRDFHIETVSLTIVYEIS